jgi:hypothetical protein
MKDQLSRELWTLNVPLYSMNPSLRKRFMKKLISAMADYSQAAASTPPLFRKDRSLLLPPPRLQAGAKQSKVKNR